MDDRQQPVLDYRRGDDRRARVVLWLGRLALVLAAYPLIFLTLLHGLWVWECAHHGESPYPLTHGPNNAAMEMLYVAVGVAYGGVCIVGGFAGMLLLALFTEHFDSPRGRRVLLIAVASWALSFTMFAWDPIGAWNFYID
jgi:hypothetical protein